MRTKWVGLVMVGALALLLVGCSGDGAAVAQTDAQVAVADHDADGHADEAVEADHDADEHADEAVEADHDADGHADEAVEADHEADGHADEAVEADHEADGHDDEAMTMLADEAVDLAINLTFTNFAYEPRLIVANVGDLLLLRVENDTYDAAVPHDFTIEKIDFEMQIISLAGDGEHAHGEGMEMDAADLHFALTDAGVGEVYVRVHEAGDYIFYCTVPGHRALGMEGVLRVN